METTTSDILTVRICISTRVEVRLLMMAGDMVITPTEMVMEDGIIIKTEIPTRAELILEELIQDIGEDKRQ